MKTCARRLGLVSLLLVLGGCLATGDSSWETEGGATPEIGEETAAVEKGAKKDAATREERIDVVWTYLDALASHDGSGVLLAEDARRTENGIETGRGAQNIRDGFSQPHFQIIKRVRDARFVVEGEQVVVFYMVDTGTASPDAHTASAYISERFLVKGGLIHEIEALFWPAPGLAPTEPAW